MLGTIITAFVCAADSIASIKNPASVESVENGKNIEVLRKSTRDISMADKIEYSINDSYLNFCDFVISQKETIEVKDVIYNAPIGLSFSDDGKLSKTDGNIFKNDTYTEPGGYVTITTTAYQYGLYDGHLVYRITSHAEINKDFFFDKIDNLIIRSGENAAFYDGIECEGKSSVYDIKNGKHELIDTGLLKPSFSKGPGVVYSFAVVQDTGFGDEYNPRQTIVDGEYFLVATDTTEVQSVYVHNQSLFNASLNFNFGAVGIDIPLNWTDAAIYYATPLTLDGYADLINREFHSINQADYGFEEQYFFYEKSAIHDLDGLKFETKRLRCGYIEEEYINLSAQREGAGEAYLEFVFEKPIYQMNCFLTFWSNNENFQANDTAYIEYLDLNNNWIKTFDLFDKENPLPTNRSNPKLYSFYFIQGTRGIRFSSTTQNPYADRNKGRICIGEINFVTYDI